MITSNTNERRAGLWLIGALGGVGSTAVLGLAALRRGLIDGCGLVTDLPMFRQLDLDSPNQFVVGGHDIRKTSYLQAVGELHSRSNVFDQGVISGCSAELNDWSENIRVGTVQNAGPTIAKLADQPQAQRLDTPRAVIDRIQADLREFQEKHRLDQVVVVNIASTEPPVQLGPAQSSLGTFLSDLERTDTVIPASSLYAWATIDLGWPYINFTPSLGACFAAIQELAVQKKSVYGGKDGKTGETLLKSVLAPMFAHRNLKILSWVGHNIFGNRDGLVLDDPRNKASKIQTKDQVISQIVGYKPQTHVSIEYIESLDDWKTAWDHIHFRGFLGTKMTMQFTWQGCDSLLAAPLVLDLARLALFAKRRGETGVLKHLACFFKSPVGVEEHDFFKQWNSLESYVAGAMSDQKEMTR